MVILIQNLKWYNITSRPPPQSRPLNGRWTPWGRGLVERVLGGFFNSLEISKRIVFNTYVFDTFPESWISGLVWFRDFTVFFFCKTIMINKPKETGPKLTFDLWKGFYGTNHAWQKTQKVALQFGSLPSFCQVAVRLEIHIRRPSSVCGKPHFPSQSWTSMTAESLGWCLSQTGWGA